MTQELVAWKFKGIAGFKTHITDTQYQSLHQEEKKWYEPYKCVNCTHSQPKTEQEPVAWGNFKEDGTLVGLSQHPEDQTNWQGRKPLFAHPQPKREWVGLTEEEVKHEWEIWRANVPRYAGFAKGIEAKLKQKNGCAVEKNT